MDGLGRFARLCWVVGRYVALVGELFLFVFVVFLGAVSERFAVSKQ